MQPRELQPRNPSNPHPMQLRNLFDPYAPQPYSYGPPQPYQLPTGHHPPTLQPHAAHHEPSNQFLGVPSAASRVQSPIERPAPPVRNSIEAAKKRMASTRGRAEAIRGAAHVNSRPEPSLHSGAVDQRRGGRPAFDIDRANMPATVIDDANMAQGERWQEQNLAQKQADEEARAQGFLPKKKKVRKDRKAPADPSAGMACNEEQALVLIAAGAANRTGLDAQPNQPDQPDQPKQAMRNASAATRSSRPNDIANGIIPSNNRGVNERIDTPGTRVKIDINHPANFAMNARGRGSMYVAAAREAGERGSRMVATDSLDDRTAVAQGFIRPNPALTATNDETPRPQVTNSPANAVHQILTLIVSLASTSKRTTAA